MPFTPDTRDSHQYEELLARHGFRPGDFDTLVIEQLLITGRVSPADVEQAVDAVFTLEN